MQNTTHNFWDLMPTDTNAMEGSHADNNQKQGTNWSIVEAILMYVVTDSLVSFQFLIHAFNRVQKSDQDMAKQLKTSIASGIFQNQNNSLENCFAHQRNHKTSASHNKAASSAVSEAQGTLWDEICTAAEQSKIINAQKKLLQEQLKELKRLTLVKGKGHAVLSVPSEPRFFTPFTSDAHLSASFGLSSSA